MKTERRLDHDELEILTAYDAGELASVASRDEIEKLRAAARATGTKDRRVNIRLSSADVRDIQALALREGIPVPDVHREHPAQVRDGEAGRARLI